MVLETVLEIVMVTEIEGLEAVVNVARLMTVLERCIKQRVLIVKLNVKFLSNLQGKDLCIARIVLQSISLHGSKMALVCKACNGRKIKSRTNYTHGKKSKSSITKFICKKCGSSVVSSDSVERRRRTR